MHRRRCGRDARGCLVNNAGESHSATAPSLWKRAAKEATGRLLVNEENEYLHNERLWAVDNRAGRDSHPIRGFLQTVCVTNP